MSVPDIDYISEQFYHWLCERLGTEDVVRTRRTYYAVKDFFIETDRMTYITSGSRGEGLKLKGSDIDIMFVDNLIQVRGKPSRYLYAEPNIFCMITDDTKPGFTRLQLISRSVDAFVSQLCVRRGANLFLSSENIKKYYLSTTMARHNYKIDRIIHGPCISDPTGIFDRAFCVRSKQWVNQAVPWILRSRKWPCAKLVSLITSFGVLFVPIGCKSSPNEDIEWRISFSVAEKHLIYSFTHCQLLCYALLKLFMKEVIEKQENLKGLLCSYYLKTIIFWVSEELSILKWRPEELISCFFRCFKRLIYCVRYEMLPHYFITENNLFENRFNTEERLQLLNVMVYNYNRGIYCMMESKTVSLFFQDVNFTMKQTSMSSIDTMCRNINVLASLKFEEDFDLKFSNLVNTALKIFKVWKLKSNKFIVSVLFYYFVNLKIPCMQDGETESSNKYIYQRYRQYLQFFMIGTQADAVSGWLYLATFFYCNKNYEYTLQIMQFILTKCCHDQIFNGLPEIGISMSSELLNGIEIEAFNRDFINTCDIFNRYVIDILVFRRGSKLIPTELNMELHCNGTLYKSPFDYAHFLRFLCWYHLQDNVKCRKALENLAISSISCRNDIISPLLVKNSFNCVGIAHFLLNENYFALHFIHYSHVKIDPQGEFLQYMINEIRQST